MNTEQILAEIRDANLSYLGVAQNLIRMDKAEAVQSLGISEESAELLGQLSTAQMVKLATGSTLLCRFPVDDDMVWSLLTHHGLPSRADHSADSQALARSLLAAAA
ncbi:flagellar transcriptional regulator FlhD [Xylophilus rhododendri]|uniref:Flagellar transcriptional regulator FlhD n=1 Tax=Xylophilus rhododendri TaxID=2697032 RepID=A0A857J8U0_9BURK|nr:flagellar transcriptional regulator FlhD [Xylophilus rhododendri]QHJ00461.1 flagellar transcriptional regulator FlhD [Xylophilus rhododendri]